MASAIGEPGGTVVPPADLGTGIIPPDHDRGTAYGRAPGTPDLYLTQVGPGTPGGEFWRRYWNPVALSEDATTTPIQIRILGEDLILFRNGRGEPGLLYPRCVHRGTSLIYGKCEDDGIRCCYHGWKFAPDGTCLDQPC
ncbi:MAG TPA: Rieske 2Fe-2S domain-containing protein, partial [Sphingomonas sp.]|nr:Rieske 2Fe-2S domain-containing protein [Sphingomonas sp.]